MGSLADENTADEHCEDSLNINDLPEEIIIHILSFLSLTELLNSGLVCKSWSELTTEPQPWQLVNRSRLEGIVTTRRLERLLSSKYVQRINLDRCRSFDESVLHKIPGEAKLQYLSLEGCSQIYSDPSFLIDLLRKDPFKSLKHLNLSGKGAGVTDDLLNVIANSCSNLISLKVTDPSRISSIGLLAIMTRCTGLKHLNIADCYSVTDEFLIELSKMRNILETLQIENCRGFTKRGLGCLGKLTKLIALRADEIDMDDSSVSSLTGLKSLNLRCCRITTAGVSVILRNNPELEYLNLSGTSINDEALILISKSACRITLNNLLFGACSCVTEVGVEAILKKCRRLQFIVMPNRVTWSDLEKIVIAVLGVNLLPPTPFPGYSTSTDPVDDMDSEPDFGMSRNFPFANIRPFDGKVKYVRSDYY